MMPFKMVLKGTFSVTIVHKMILYTKMMMMMMMMMMDEVV